jgi:hypothetical protein
MTTAQTIDTAPTDRNILLGIQRQDTITWQAPCSWSKAGEISENGLWIWWVPGPEWLLEVKEPTHWAELP